MIANTDIKVTGSGLQDEPPPSEQEIRDELKLILSSRAFRLAQSQKSFLEYTVGESLAGRAHHIKEYLIGTEAFGRGEDFDPRLDPIVRTQARKLRARLTQYYETEGSGDPIRIEFRKGSYAPTFRRADSAAADEAVPQLAAETVFNQPATAFAAPPAPVPPTPPSSRRFAVLIAALAIAFIGAIGLYISLNWRVRHPAETASIAVMPFANLSAGDDSNNFLSEGLSLEVMKLLQQVPQMHVVGRASAFRLRSKAEDVKGLGKALHVHNVLVGTVRRSGERIVVTVQLNSVDGYHLWSGTYDRQANDVGAIPQEISQSIVNVLGVALPRREIPQSLSAQLSPTPGAHESYLKGLYFWNKLTAESLKSAIGYFEDAIAEDPSYARAYAALADCYVVAPQVADTPPVEVVNKIKEAASTALALDNTLGEAHFDLAITAEFNFDWTTAEKEFQKGLELSPGNVVGRLWYAKFLGLMGRADEVFVQRRIAAQLDPVSPYAIQSVAGYLSVIGRYDEAVKQFKAALALEPNFGLAHQGLGVTYLLMGLRDPAFEELRLADQFMDGRRRRALLGFAYGVTGQTAQAHRVLSELLDEYQRGRTPAVAIAQVYVGLGDNTHAFEWLNKAVDQRDLNVDLKWDSVWATIRSDTRYKQVLHRMKLE